MKSTSLFVVCLFLAITGSAQTWSILPNAPYSQFNRQDDIYFVNNDTGWVVNTGGELYRTFDGGTSWDTLLIGAPIFCRSIGFLNGQTGIMGNYGDFLGNSTPVDSNALFRTTDAGQTWLPVTNYNGPAPKGICGISVVNDSVVFAVGRASGDPAFIKSTNGGVTFESQDMSPWSSGLIDCYFISPDSGWVVGRSPGATLQTSVATVLFTPDGGQNWQTLFTGGSAARWCWKIFFPSKLTGYISVENHWILGQLDTNYVLKTTDGGQTWQQLTVDQSAYRLQGIGFVNDTIGWAGEDYVRKTTDGGLSWQSSTDLNYFNRMRSVNDSVKYAAGQTISKYQPEATGIVEEPASMENNIQIINCAPNPFDNNIDISYTISKAGNLSLWVYEIAGIPVYRTGQAHKPPGTYEETIKLSGLPAGVYYVVVSLNRDQKVIKMIKSK